MSCTKWTLHYHLCSVCSTQIYTTLCSTVWSYSKTTKYAWKLKMKYIQSKVVHGKRVTFETGTSQVQFPGHELAQKHQARLWLSKLGVDTSIGWTESAPPGWDRVKVAAKTWCGHVPTSTCPQACLGLLWECSHSKGGIICLWFQQTELATE